MSILDKKDNDDIDKELQSFFTSFYIQNVKAILQGSSLYKHTMYNSDL
jgi:hypothetical protein